MIRTTIISLCFAAALLPLAAGAQDVRAQTAHSQDERQYTDGPVTEVDYIHVDYGHFAEYVDWLNSKWKPTMEAMKKAGLIIDYKVFQANPKTPDQPNTYLWITFKNGAAALDKGVELEEVAAQVICSTECQNKARVARGEYRRVLGTELIREVIFGGSLSGAKDLDIMGLACAPKGVAKVAQGEGCRGFVVEPGYDVILKEAGFLRR